MAGDLHKPLIEMLEDERKAGCEIGKKIGRTEVVELVNELLHKMTFKTSYVYQNFVDPWESWLKEWGMIRFITPETAPKPHIAGTKVSQVILDEGKPN